MQNIGVFVIEASNVSLEVLYVLIKENNFSYRVYFLKCVCNFVYSLLYTNL